MLEAATAARPATGRRSLRKSIDLSVVIPTRNEAESVPPLVAELVRALGNGVRAELIFVDDSDDETPTVVLTAARTAGSAMPIRICHRPVGSREGGLGGAVKRGFEEASGRFVAVMDADLQHPPDLLPALIAKAQSEQVDVVVATRFVDGGTTGKFGCHAASYPAVPPCSRSCCFLAGSRR